MSDDRERNTLLLLTCQIYLLFVDNSLGLLQNEQQSIRLLRGLYHRDSGAAAHVATYLATLDKFIVGRTCRFTAFP